MTATDAAFIDNLAALHQKSTMVGWDFSVLAGSLRTDNPWWDFDADCLAALHDSARVADQGNGGGERLLRLLAALPTTSAARQITATEGWAPNLPVARKNLVPAGIDVREYDAERGDRMPFATGELDLVMSRHEAIAAQEIARVLVAGGRFLTQQGRKSTRLNSSHVARSYPVFRLKRT